MNTARYLFRRGWLSFFLCWLFCLPGCIREDRSDCPPEAEDRLVVLKIMDEVTGRDITETGEAGSAVLYLFSPDGHFVGRVSVTGEQIVHRAPVLLPVEALDRCHVSTWTNAGAGQLFHSPAQGSGIEERAVSLIEGEDAFHGTPDDLFFGHARLAPVGAAGPEVITLARKNARMRITVRGLDRRIPEDRYYLTVEIPNDGYDFVGNPIAGTARVRRTGAFHDNGDFSTDEAFNLIHTDPAVSPAGGVTVNLYEKALGRSADRLIASVTDDDGRPISLPAGRTVNLLIDLNEGEGLSVYTEITPWDEIYQWDIW